VRQLRRQIVNYARTYSLYSRIDLAPSSSVRYLTPAVYRLLAFRQSIPEQFILIEVSGRGLAPVAAICKFSCVPPNYAAARANSCVYGSPLDLSQQLLIAQSQLSLTTPSFIMKTALAGSLFERSKARDRLLTISSSTCNLGNVSTMYQRASGKSRIPKEGVDWRSEAEPPAESRDRVPGQGIRWRSTEAESFLAF